MSYTTKILVSCEEIAEIAEDWERLWRRQTWRRSEAHPFSLRMEAESRRGACPRVIALFDRDEMVGIAPFSLSQAEFPWRAGRRVLARFPVRRAAFPGDSLILPEDPAAQETLLHAILEACAACDQIRFEYLPADSAFWNRVRSASFIRRKRWFYDRWGPATRWMIRMPERFEEYLTKFGRKTRSDLRREIRQLREACPGGLTLVRITERAQLPLFLEDMEWLSERTWQGQKLGHIVRANAEERERFEALADQGWLRCYLLKNGAEPLAFVLGRQMDNLYHWEEIGYDPAWAKYAPGKALLYLHLEDLFAEKRPDWLDMGRGPYGYKAFFANYCYEEANAYLIRKSLYMSIAMGLPAAGDQIKRVGRARFRRLLRKG